MLLFQMSRTIRQVSPSFRWYTVMYLPMSAALPRMLRLDMLRRLPSLDR